MAHYRDLIVWQKAMELTVEVYRITKQLPKDEIYSLCNQIRRAAVSVPSNIAEGAGRKSYRDFCHFLKIANGSLNELETQLILCGKLNYLSVPAIDHAMQLSSEVGRILSVMIQKLNTEY